MYVKWEVRDRKSRRGSLLTASLVEAYRKEGKPRTWHIAYLGSIRIGNLKQAEEQIKFWRHAQAAFRRVGLSDKQKFAIDKKLTRFVKKPAPDMVATIDYLDKNREFLQLAIRKETRLGLTLKEQEQLLRAVGKGDFNIDVGGSRFVFNPAVMAMIPQEILDLLK
jgi:Uri superfamily endonuclease